jgi:hypothetical protein
MSKKNQIRKLLSDGKPHTKDELIPITHRFSAVIHSLRHDDGYDITTIKVGHNDCIYQMKTA